jgi:iron complex transport system substrate-binding protein
MGFPRRIICLTEESVETLYLLGRQDLIQGVSKFVERPPEAKLNHPIVAEFIRADVEKILSAKPDLVLGFSDLQKDIARELIGRGLNVLITNQRSLSEILNQIELIGRVIGETTRAQDLVATFQKKLQSYSDQTATRRPRVYFEEWDRPRLSAIQWVSELIEVAGGENIFADRVGSLARDREVHDAEVISRDPELILGCWCGKPVKLDSFAQRAGYSDISAIQHNQIKEVSPAIFLQPGPALFVDGLDQLAALIQQVRREP